MSDEPKRSHRTYGGYSILFDGSILVLWKKNPITKYITYRLRKVVSPSFISLWNDVENGDFDETLWADLEDQEKDLMGSIANLSNTRNHKLNVALSRYSKHTFDRLKLIEGAVKAGNMNKALVEEYIGIIDKLCESRQIAPISGGRMKAKIKRTYDYLLNELIHG